VAKNFVRSRPEAFPVFPAVTGRLPRLPFGESNGEGLFGASGLDEQKHSIGTKQPEDIIEQLHKTRSVEPVKCVRGRDYVIVVAQAVVPISVPEVAHEILSGNAFAPVYSIANRDEKHITVDTVHPCVPLAPPYALADIA